MVLEHVLQDINVHAVQGPNDHSECMFYGMNAVVSLTFESGLLERERGALQLLQRQNESDQCIRLFQWNSEHLVDRYTNNSA